jgi:hypothetical protein
MAGPSLAFIRLMKSDPIRGKTIRWTFSDGPMAKKTFEHTFGEDGSVTFRALDAKGDGAPTHVDKYEVASLEADVHAVSYLGPSGYTLTVVLDDRSGKLVAFASNEKTLMLQHGTFEEVAGSTSATRPDSGRGRAPMPIQ